MKKTAAILTAFWLFAACCAWQRIGGGGFFAFWSLATAAFIAASSLSFGMWALERFGMDFGDRPLHRIPAALTLGLGAAALGAFALGALRLLYPAALTLLLGGFLWLGRHRLAGIRRADFPRETGWTAFACAALAAVSLLLCFVPPQQYDSLVYHLALPQLYALRHAVGPVPENVFSHFPQNGEMLFSAGLLLGSDIAGQLLSWLCAAAACLWIYAYAARFRAPGLAVILAATHTAFLLLGTTTYVEPIVCLFTTAAVIALLEWRVTVQDGQARLWLALAGIYCGLGLGTKYYAGITAAALFFIGIQHCYGISRFSERKKRMQHLLIFAAASLAVFLPWAVKNIHETGNPFYPFFYRLLNSGSPAEIAEAKSYFAMLSEYGRHSWFLSDLLSFPVSVFSHPGRFGGGMDALGIAGWDLFFAGTPLMVIAAARNRELRWPGVYLLLHFMAWFITAKVLRFLVVIVPLGSVLIAEGYMLAREEGGRLARAALAAGLAVFIAGRLVSWTYVTDAQRGWNYLFGLQSRGDYLAAAVPYYRCAEALNNTAAPDARVLIAGDQRSYYLRRDSAATSLTHPNRFVAAANSAKSPEELAGLLAREFDYIVYVPAEERRLRFYGTLNFTDAGRKNWDGMFSGGGVVFKTDRCELYRLK